MFERIRNVLASRRGPASPQPELQRWAQEQGLVAEGRKDGGFSLGGVWQGRAFRAECSPSTRSYIRGFELKARAELSLNPEVGLVLMNRALKGTFEAQANALFEDVTDALATRARDVPQEVRWLSLYRDVGWPGPQPDFWTRYAVLTDAPDLARQGLDQAVVDMLCQWPEARPEASPVLLLLDRGNAYLRLQLGTTLHADVALHALDTFGAFSARLAGPPPPA